MCKILKEGQVYKVVSLTACLVFTVGILLGKLPEILSFLKKKKSCTRRQLICSKTPALFILMRTILRVGIKEEFYCAMRLYSNQCIHGQFVKLLPSLNHKSNQSLHTRPLNEWLSNLNLTHYSCHYYF